MPESSNSNSSPPTTRPMPWLEAQREREEKEIRERYLKFYKERERRASSEGQK